LSAHSGWINAGPVAEFLAAPERSVWSHRGRGREARAKRQIDGYSQYFVEPTRAPIVPHNVQSTERPRMPPNAGCETGRRDVTVVSSSRMAERAVQIDVAGLRWDPGATEPVVVANERRTLFAFRQADADAMGDDSFQTAEFVECASVRLGFPDDEVLRGHPLWGRGLEFYALHEVEDSSWLHLARSIARVHRSAPANPLPDAKHFILTFHDSTLEAIASSVTPLAVYSSLSVATSALAAALGTNSRPLRQ